MGVTVAEGLFEGMIASPSLSSSAEKLGGLDVFRLLGPGVVGRLVAEGRVGCMGGFGRVVGSGSCRSFGRGPSAFGNTGAMGSVCCRGGFHRRKE
eukprot:scaffold306147_cov63-Attheya_sp.AAC.1